MSVMRMASTLLSGSLALTLTLTLAACGGTPVEPPLDLAALKNPESCKSCHPTQYAEWSGSMHAYAAEDPVFRAMNARGQRETKGALGSFCIKCHAPLAVQAGLTTDGLNLDSVPRELHGVTCFFCHSVDEVTGEHDAALHLATDQILRAGIADPVATPAHQSGYSTLHDRQSKRAAALCGSCHDIITPGGVALERTYDEWKQTVFAKDTPGTLLTCGKCHMAGTIGLAAQAPGAISRTIHSHTFAAVDVAMTDFPNMQPQRAEILAQLRTTLSSKLCVMPDAGNTSIVVTLDNVAAGHSFPSGATQDRRAWVEVAAFVGNQRVFGSGVVIDGQEPSALPDADLWLLRDQLFDGMGKPVHMFWDAARLTSEQLGASVTNDPKDPRFFHAVTRTYKATGAPDRVTVKVRMRPFGLDVLDDLTASGDLDRKYRDQVPTFDLGGTALEWTRARGYGCVP